MDLCPTFVGDAYASNFLYDNKGMLRKGSCEKAVAKSQLRKASCESEF